MPGFIYVEGVEKIKLVGIALRKLGTDRTIVNEMAKNIRKMGTPLRDEIRDSAASTLPKRGGLNEWVARAKIRVSVRRGARTAGISLVVGKDSAHGRTDIRSIDAGATRHPLWGNRRHWYPETVRPGFATRVMEGPAADEFRTHALEAIDTAIEQVLHGF